MKEKDKEERKKNVMKEPLERFLLFCRRRDGKENVRERERERES